LHIEQHSSLNITNYSSTPWTKTVTPKYWYNVTLFIHYYNKYHKYLH